MAKRKTVKKRAVKPVAVITGKLANFKKMKIPVLKANDGKVKQKSGSKGAERLLSDKQMAQLKKMHASHTRDGKRKYSNNYLCEKFKVSQPTLYNYVYNYAAR